jgi:hypothetical protein
MGPRRLAHAAGLSPVDETYSSMPKLQELLQSMEHVISRRSCLRTEALKQHHHFTEYDELLTWHDLGGMQLECMSRGYKWIPSIVEEPQGSRKGII